MRSIVRVRIKRVSSERELNQALAIRRRVFVREQGVPAELELDRDDEAAVHLLASVSGRAVGTARIVFRRRSAKIGRMAVLKTHRGKGVGQKLLGRALAIARRRGAERLYLHAQVAAIGFYQAAGFRPTGAVFGEAGIPHRKMILAPA